MLADWRRRAIAATDEMVVDSLLAAARAAAQERPDQAAFGSAAEAEAEEVLAAVSGRRTTFRRRHVLAEARRYLMRTLAGATVPPRAVEGITEKGLAHAGCLDITPPGIPPAPRSATGRRHQYPPGRRLSHLHHPVPACRREPAAGRSLSG
ncbi:hypothetical protein ACFW6M_36100 [Streptomyces nigra]|uniref:hypothetical protein n=1 Tax=Streptomyces nigra TaxID=1827580 RepID=UPI0036B6B78C